MNRNARGLAADAAPAPGRRTFGKGKGFTLIELLIVLTIMALLTVAALPTIMTSLDEREILDASGMLQSALLVARDIAMRTGNAAGIRLLLDPDVSTGGALAANRLVPIVQAPDYNSGQVQFQQLHYDVGDPSTSPPTVVFRFSAIAAYEHKFQPDLSNPNTIIDANYAPTSWYWNVRQGETLRVAGSGPRYTIAGPMYNGDTLSGDKNIGGTSTMNPERFLHQERIGASQPVVSLPTLAGMYPGTVAAPTSFAGPASFAGAGYPAFSGASYWSEMTTSLPTVLNINYTAAEVLYLTNGRDDDGDGVIDEGFDGIDNDGDGIVDPGFNGRDDDGNGLIDEPGEMLLNYNPLFPASGEYEPETLDSTNASRAGHYVSTPWAMPGYNYVINRRAVVAENAVETRLPANIVVDLTMLDRYSGTAATLQPERSRLPLDPIAQTVDVLFGANGQVIEDTAGVSTLVNNRNLPFYHFWLATKSDVFGIAYGGNPPNPANLTLDPANARFLPTPYSSPTTLKGQRRLVTLFPKTGNTVVNSVEDFTTVEQPYQDAQFGKREP